MSSRKRIRYGVPGILKSSIISIFKSYSVILLFLFIIPLPTEADDPSPPYSRYLADFEDEFPPIGWSLQTKTMGNIWKKANDAANGIIMDDYGFFAYASSEGKSPFDEYLISEEILIEEEYFYDNYMWHPLLSFCLAYESSDYLNRYDLTLEISLDKKNWTKIFSFEKEFERVDGQWGWEPGQWRECYVALKDYEGKKIWIAFRYFGTQGSGIAIDDLFINASRSSAYFSNNCIDGPCEIDLDAKHFDSIPSDDSNQEVCGIVFHDPAAPLALFMVMVGLIAFFLKKRT